MEIDARETRLLKMQRRLEVETPEPLAPEKADALALALEKLAERLSQSPGALTVDVQLPKEEPPAEDAELRQLLRELVVALQRKKSFRLTPERDHLGLIQEIIIEEI